VEACGFSRTKQGWTRRGLQPRRADRLLQAIDLVLADSRGPPLPRAENSQSVAVGLQLRAENLGGAALQRCIRLPSTLSFWGARTELARRARRRTCFRAFSLLARRKPTAETWF